MKIIRTLCLAFSMYSRIPMPILEYTEDDMRYTFLAFPLIGVIIGAVQYVWYILCNMLGTGTSLYAAVAVVLPLCITGGFHMDGYLDTTDALSSHREKERKLEILKDSHVGAFAVIWTGVYLLVSYGLYTEISGKAAILCTSAGFVLSRATSGLAAIHFPSATGRSSLASFAQAGDRTIVKIGLWIWIIVTFVSLICFDKVYGTGILAVLAVWYGYYHHMSKKEFGGITGDLAGWYLQTCELCILGIVVFLPYLLHALNR